MIAQAAKEVGVCAETLRRWESARKIPKARRDRNGFRYYVEDDIEKIRAYRDSEAE